MKNNEFWDRLISALDFPFEINQVVNIEESLGTIYFELEDESVYYLSINSTEAEEDTVI